MLINCSSKKTAEYCLIWADNADIQSACSLSGSFSIAESDREEELPVFGFSCLLFAVYPQQAAFQEGINMLSELSVDMQPGSGNQGGARQKAFAKRQDRAEIAGSQVVRALRVCCKAEGD